MHNVSFWVSVCTSIWAGVFLVLWLKKSGDFRRYRDMIDLRDDSRYQQEQLNDISRSLSDQIDEIRREIGGVYNELDSRISRNSSGSYLVKSRTKKLDF